MNWTDADFSTAAASAVAPTSVILLPARSMRWSDADFSMAAASAFRDLINVEVGLDGLE